MVAAESPRCSADHSMVVSTKPNTPILLAGLTHQGCWRRQEGGLANPTSCKAVWKDGKEDYGHGLRHAAAKRRLLLTKQAWRRKQSA